MACAIALIVVLGYPLYRTSHQSLAAWSQLLVPMLLLSLLGPAAWSHRNVLHSGHVFFSPLIGYNLALHNMPTIEELYLSGVFDNNVQEKRFAELVGTTQNIPRTLKIVREEFELDEFAADRIAQELALKSMYHRPVQYVVRTMYHPLNIFIAPADAMTIFSPSAS